MKRFIKILTTASLAVAFMFGLTGLTPALAASPAAVNLGTAGNFAILAGTPNLTSVPTSVITGDVGLSPATGAGIIGLTAAEVTGTIYAVDAAGPLGSVNNPTLLTSAKNDLTAAYIDVMGRTPTITVPTELGGTTKTPGVYVSGATTFGITAGMGPLVIDAQGDPNAIFIFEANFDGTGLTVGPGSTVSLVNGASACNVYWRVISASIDTTAVFKGNILALTSITANNGANIEGRLLARNGNVTLIADTITRPICLASTTTTATTASSDTTGLPNTGAGPEKSSVPWNIVILAGIIVLPIVFYLTRRKQTN